MLVRWDIRKEHLAIRSMLDRSRNRLVLALCIIAAVVGLFAAWTRIAPPVPVAGTTDTATSRPLLSIALPPVEAVLFQPVSPETALKINAAIPFSELPNPAAAPFRFAGVPADLARAVDCLASAIYYEAGADVPGQQAVAQVVLNRLRHPAFPKTVCGVVFQGAERTTGCQFTFTCDGALTRAPSASGWSEARKRALQALTGSVYAPIGYATHYHTDWVAPYWSDSLDKIAAVRTHLFFKWKGWWGTPGAFLGKPSSGEPVIGKIAQLSPAHGLAPTDPAAIDPQLATAGILGEDRPFMETASASSAARVLLQDADGVVILLDRGVPAENFAQLAASFCGARDLCKVRGWVDPANAPKSYPLGPGALATMSFSYLRNRGQSFEKALWNCDQFRRGKAAECLKIPFKHASAKSAAPAPAPVISVALAER